MEATPNTFSRCQRKVSRVRARFAGLALPALPFPCQGCRPTTSPQETLFMRPQGSVSPGRSATRFQTPVKHPVQFPDSASPIAHRRSLPWLSNSRYVRTLHLGTPATIANIKARHRTAVSHRQRALSAERKTSPIKGRARQPLSYGRSRARLPRQLTNCGSLARSLDSL